MLDDLAKNKIDVNSDRMTLVKEYVTDDVYKNSANPTFPRNLEYLG